MSHPREGEGEIQSLSHQKKKKNCPKYVSGHLESFKAHLSLGEKRGVLLLLSIFYCFWPTFDEFWGVRGLCDICHTFFLKTSLKRLKTLSWIYKYHYPLHLRSIRNLQLLMFDFVFARSWIANYFLIKCFKTHYIVFTSDWSAVNKIKYHLKHAQTDICTLIIFKDKEIKTVLSWLSFCCYHNYVVGMDKTEIQLWLILLLYIVVAYSQG